MVKSWENNCKLAPDWLHRSEQPIRSQASKLTQLLTMTTTHKFPLQGTPETDPASRNDMPLAADSQHTCFKIKITLIPPTKVQSRRSSSDRLENQEGILDADISDDDDTDRVCEQVRHGWEGYNLFGPPPIISLCNRYRTGHIEK